jgi:hypothetical protein
MHNALAKTLSGVMSPKPVVVIVTQLKYRDSKPVAGAWMNAFFGNAK